MRLTNKGFIIFICVFFFAAGISLAGFIFEKREHKEAKVLYEAVQKSKVENIKKVSANYNTSENTVKEIDFKAMKKKFPDMVGWLYEEGTGIDYPIVQEKDNEFYLSHLADGRKNKLGAIFLDFSANDDFSSPVSVIYGHEIKNGSMFGNLHYYRNQEFYEKYPQFTLFTENAVFKIELIGSYLDG